MDIKTTITGILPIIVIISAILTAIGSVMLLWLYRRAVLGAMRMSSGLASPPPQTQLAENLTKGTKLKIATVTGEIPVSAKALEAYEASAISLWRLSAVYGAAALTYAIVMSLTWMVLAGNGYPLARLLWLVICYLWPGVLAILMLAATVSRTKYVVLGIYFTLVAVVGAVLLMRTSALDVLQLIFFWFFANGIATVLLVAFLTRRVRAVGPLVLAFMILGVTGAFLSVNFIGSGDTLLRVIADVGNQLGLGAISLFTLLHIIGFVIFGVLGWSLLGWLGRAYRNKSISDQSLMMDALFLLFGVVQSFTLAFEGWAWFFTGLFAFAAYKLVAMFGYTRAAVRDTGGQARQYSMLLLRVFALGRRSERLFDNLSRYWLRTGSIDLIAGPDLVTSTVEPHEFLEFVGGQLSRRFINSEMELDQHMAARDILPDPDGRYRVNEFFCRQDTWQMTMRRLATKSDVVLMDLRSFSTCNQGCLWELEQLLIGVPLERVLLVTDNTTDHQFLEKMLQVVWRRVPAESPNRDIKEPSLHLVAVSNSISQATQTLLKSLYQACITPTT